MDGQLFTFLDNREFALVSWFAVLIVALLISKKLRPTVTGVLKAMFAWKLVILYFAMVAYTIGVVYLLMRTRVATTDQLSEVVFWFFGPAVILFSRFDKASQDEDFFKKTFYDTVRYTVVLEFLINLRPANIAIELIMVPVFVLLGATLAVAGTSAQYQSAKRFLEVLNGIIVLALLAYTAVGIVENPSEFATLNSLRDLLIPLLLTIAFLPFIYIIALASAYETFFIRLGFLVKDQDLTRYAKRKIIRAAFLRIDTLRRITQENPGNLMQAASKSEIDGAIDRARRTKPKGV